MSRNKRKPTVTIYINGTSYQVPERAGCMWAARGILGMARLDEVTYEGSMKKLKFINGHLFKSGDRYRVISKEERRSKNRPTNVNKEDPTEELPPWARDADWWKTTS